MNTRLYTRYLKAGAKPIAPARYSVVCFWHTKKAVLNYLLCKYVVIVF